MEAIHQRLAYLDLSRCSIVNPVIAALEPHKHHQHPPPHHPHHHIHSLRSHSSSNRHESFQPLEAPTFPASNTLKVYRQHVEIQMKHQTYYSSSFNLYIQLIYLDFNVQFPQSSASLAV